MAVFSDFHALVLPRLQGCSEISVELAARQSAIEFCRRTLAMQKILDSVATVAEQATYTVASGDEVIHKLLGVKLDDEPLELLRDVEFDWAARDTSGTPTGALLSGPRVIELYPVPSVDGYSVVVRAAMAPSQASSTLDDSLFEEHAQAIADGAVARLAAQANRSYTDPGTAQECQARFDAEIDRVKARVFYSHSRAPTRSINRLV